MDMKFDIYECDEEKYISNKMKHKVDFLIAKEFQWNTSILKADDRESYGELREVATGFIGERVYVMVFVRRNGMIRLISLRKANEREIRKYERSQKA